MDSTSRILVVVYVPPRASDQSEDTYLRTVVGDNTTGTRGPLLEALHQALQLNPAQLAQVYITLSRAEIKTAGAKTTQAELHKLPTLQEVYNQIINFGEVYGFHPNPQASERTMHLLTTAYVQEWRYLGHQRANEHTAAARALGYARQHGFKTILLV